MSSRLLHPDEYELEARSSVDSQGTFDLDEADFESQIPPRSRRFHIGRFPFLSRLFSSTYSGYRRLKPSRPLLSASSRPSCYRRLLLRRSCFFLHAFVGIILALLILTSIFRPSYTRPPPHYVALRDSVSQSQSPSGRGNTRNEKVFIAASLYDSHGELAGGEWGTRLLRLIDLLGEENVFVSIYENDSGAEGESALRGLEDQIPCNSSIVFEEHFDLDSLPRVTIPGGSARVKRVQFLAEARNRALRPLDESDQRYDKLLYLNDVIFDPVDAVQLLFSTNVDDNGVAQYRAACAVDFLNPFKFYDTYATRDLQGYGVGVPFFPWFSTAGDAQSRNDVLAGKDAVRVRSCWGGMAAFDARYFQRLGEGEASPVRFRATPELFWEASECCLIHADIQDPPSSVEEIEDTGIYMNPYVRVAYDARTLSWLGTTRRFEKLYSFIHTIANHLVGLPWFNPRRTEVPGQRGEELVWVPDPSGDGSGTVQRVERIAGNDGFCGRDGLQMDWSKKVMGIVQAAFDSVLEKTSYPLEESRHAPKTMTPKYTHRRGDIRTGPSSRPLSHFSSHTQLPSSSSSNSSSPALVPSHHPQPSSVSDVPHMSLTSPKEPNMPPVVNIDDTEGFMAAARALKFPKTENSYMSAASTAVEDSSSDQQPDASEDVDETPADSVLPATVYHENDVPATDETNGWGITNGHDAQFTTPAEPLVSVNETNGSVAALDLQNAISLATDAGVYTPDDFDDDDEKDDEEEDREHLTTFKTWGTPDVRDKPAAQVRRVILKGLPSSWSNPAKVLTLIHGGMVESVSITAAGNAHVVFCDADACKAFYNKYPNGIDLDKDRKTTVFVETGSEVDIVSSQLAFNLSVGATRVVRAVGADLGLSMIQLLQVASVQGRRVEKIIDHYVPGDARHVIFRFCSIDDAARFRGAIIRDEAWEQCNVQYAADPSSMVV
ncbi:cryptococcal mannosyltransferase 1-domain-containing protein [Aspergillus floccosus]